MTYSLSFAGSLMMNPEWVQIGEGVAIFSAPWSFPGLDWSLQVG